MSVPFTPTNKIRRPFHRQLFLNTKKMENLSIQILRRLYHPCVTNRQPEAECVYARIVPGQFGITVNLHPYFRWLNEDHTEPLKLCSAFLSMWAKGFHLSAGFYTLESQLHRWALVTAEHAVDSRVGCAHRFPSLRASFIGGHSPPYGCIRKIARL